MFLITSNKRKLTRWLCGQLEGIADKNKAGVVAYGLKGESKGPCLLQKIKIPGDFSRTNFKRN